MFVAYFYLMAIIMIDIVWLVSSLIAAVWTAYSRPKVSVTESLWRATFQKYTLASDDGDCAINYPIPFDALYL